MVAGTTGLSKEFIKKSEEAMSNGLLYDLVNQMYQYGNPKEEAPKDLLFEAESEVIQKLAEQGSCIIIGRCADYVLKENPNVIKLFFSAPLNSRIQRVMKRLNISSKEAEHKIRHEEKLRSDNYHYYTHQIWGNAQNFDLTINTDLGFDYIKTCINELIQH